jgi:hypothetical protein
VGAVDVDDVEARSARELSRRDPVGLDALDVFTLHRLRHHEGIEITRQLRGCNRRPTRLAHGAVSARMMELDTGKRPVLVHLFAHERKAANVVRVPEPGGYGRHLVRIEADRAVFGTDRRPAALRLRGAEPRLRPWLLDSVSCAVRYREEAIPHRLRPDPDRLEENVVSGVARQSPRVYARDPSHRLSTPTGLGGEHGDYVARRFPDA